MHLAMARHNLTQAAFAPAEVSLPLRVRGMVHLCLAKCADDRRPIIEALAEREANNPALLVFLKNATPK